MQRRAEWRQNVAQLLWVTKNRTKRFRHDRATMQGGTSCNLREPRLSDLLCLAAPLLHLTAQLLRPCTASACSAKASMAFAARGGTSCASPATARLTKAKA